MAAGDLVTLQAAENFLEQSSDPQGIIAAIVSAASTSIQNWLGYQLAAETYVRSFNGPGGDRLSLPDRPVTFVSSVMIDILSVPACVPPAPGFLFDEKFLYLRGYRFSRGVQNVTVSYEAGYETIPADIQQACLSWVSMLYAAVAEDYVAGASKLRAGDTEIDFAALTTKLGDETSLLPPTILTALQPYRRIATS